MDNVTNLAEWKRQKQEEKEKEEDKLRFTYEAYYFFDDDYTNNEFDLSPESDD